jgi:hypothetical protein
VTGVGMAAARACRCGHDRETHLHHRAGTDCALCGAATCPRYRPAHPLRAAAARVLDAVRARRIS